MWYLECPSSEFCVMAIWESLGNVGNRTYIYFGRWRSKKHIDLYLKETIIYTMNININRTWQTNPCCFSFIYLLSLLPNHLSHTTHPTATQWPPPDVASDWMDRCEAPRPGLGPGLGSFCPQGFVGCWEGRWFHVWIYLVALKYRVFHGCWKKQPTLSCLSSWVLFITPGKSPFST